MNDIKTYIAKVTDRQDLTREEAGAAMEILLSGEAQEGQIGAFLMAEVMKKESLDEIIGFTETVSAKANHISPKTEKYVDFVGTGGDKTYTFNISTTSAFVVAAAGFPVAKHGNRSISSKSGAGDVLEALGINITAEPKTVEKNIEEVGIGFMFAPTFNPSLKYVGKVRKDIGMRTVFNILGPMANPSGAKYMVVGVYDPALTEVMARALQAMGVERGFVMSGDNHMDEFTTTGTTTVSEISGDEVRTYTVTPEQFGIARATLDDLRGGDGTENAQITRDILSGKLTGAKRDIVLLNAGATLYIGGFADSVEDGIRLAAETIDSGKAYAKLEELAVASNQ